MISVEGTRACACCCSGVGENALYDIYGISKHHKRVVAVVWARDLLQGAVQGAGAGEMNCHFGLDQRCVAECCVAESCVVLQPI